MSVRATPLHSVLFGGVCLLFLQPLIAVSDEQTSPNPACNSDGDHEVPQDSGNTKQSCEKDEPFYKQGKDYLKDRYLLLTDSLDRLFSGKNWSPGVNHSKLAIESSETWYEAGVKQSDFRVRAKVDLPRTRRRYRLFVDSDPDQTRTLADRTRGVSLGSDLNKKATVAGIEYSEDAPLHRWKSSLSLGGRYDGGLRILTRYRIRKYWQPSESWLNYVHQDLWYLDGVGWGETSEVTIAHEIDDKTSVQFQFDLENRQEEKNIEYANTWKLGRKMSERATIVYTFGLLGEGEASNMADNKFINASFRYRLRNEWMDVYLTPEIFYAEEFNYRPERSLTLTFRMAITND